MTTDEQRRPPDALQAVGMARVAVSVAPRHEPSSNNTRAAAVGCASARSRVRARWLAEKRFELLRQKIQDIAFIEPRGIADRALALDHAPAARTARVSDDARRLSARVERDLDEVRGG